ncbi:MAG: AzlC family ABC transporter permease [Bacteriovoracaceae bacterium]
MSLKTSELIARSLPVALGYLALGFTFGVLFSSKGGSPFEAFIISLLCFAGAAQFVALEFYKSDSSFIFMIITIFLLNLRHVFYGLRHLSLWRRGVSQWYLFLALTDENYGMTNVYSKSQLTQSEWVKVFGLNHFYWVLACTMGALVPVSVMDYIKGADFSLVALFIVIFASAIKSKRISGGV